MNSRDVEIEAGHVTYNPVTFNLPELLKDIKSMSIRGWRERVLPMTLDIHPETLDYIISDENKVKEILINIIGNAVKFTEQGGITVSCRTEKDVKNKDLKQYTLYIDVKDTGVGIAKEEMSKLFQAFEQTRSGAKTIGGTGLGLAISRNHARLLGGDITVESTPGVGTTFHIQLTVLEGEHVHEEKEASLKK
jgi:signal transduction histidine kinase